MAISEKRKKILKSIPNYIGNVSKSVMFSGMDIIKEVAPDISEFAISTSETTKQAINESKKYSSDVLSYLRNFKNTEAYKDINQIKKNALEDLKTGNFNNKQRADQNALAAYEKEDAEMMKEAFGDEFDFGTDDDFDFEKALDAYTKNASKKQEPVVNNITVNNLSSNNASGLSKIAQVSRINANATLAAAEMQIQHSNVWNSNNRLINSQTSSMINGALSEMTGYLKGLFEYTENITTHMKTTTSFFDEAKTMLDSIKALQQETLEVTKQAFIHSADTEEKKDDVSSEDVFRNGFNVKDYIRMVKKNVQKEKDNNVALGLFDFANQQAENAGQSFLQILGSNPLEFISKGIANRFLEKQGVNASLSKANDTFKNFFKSLSIKYMAKAEDSEKPLFQILGRVLGVGVDDAKSVKTDSYVKTQVPFDGMTRKSIIEVIPTYLRKILSAFTSTPELIYDYETGTFKTKKQIKDEIKVSKDLAYTSGSNLEFGLSERMANLNVNQKDRNKILEDYKELNKFIVDNKYFFNPHENDEDRYSDMKSKGLSISKNSLDSLSNLIASLGREQVMGFNDNIYTASTKINQINADISKQMSEKGYGALYNEADNLLDMDKFNKLNNKPVTDRYNKSVIDYVRDIKGILLQGIYVYNAGKASRGRANTGEVPTIEKRLQDYINEIRKFDEKNTKSSNSGAETYGSDYVGTEIRNGSKKFMSIDRLASLSPDGIKNILAEKIIEESKNDKKKEEDKTSTNNLIDNLLSVPATAINGIIGIIDNGMYNVLYGKQGSFISSFVEDAGNVFKSIQDSINEKVLIPLNEKLFGEQGIITRLHDRFSPKFDNLKNKLSDKLLGAVDESGVRQGGLFSSLMNSGSDMFNSAKNYLFGSEYVSKVTGEHIPAKTDSVLATAKNMFADVKTNFMDFLFGKNQIDEEGNIIDVREGGLVADIKSTFNKTMDSVKTTLFGDSIGNFNLKEAMPKILAGAGIGGATSLFSALFLPFGLGLMPSMILGAGAGFVSQSDKAKEFLFGEEGVIPKNWQENFKKFFPNMAKGTAIGGILGTLTGNPLLGPMLGASIGFASKSETVKDFLFGEGKILSDKNMQKIKEFIPKGVLGAGAGLVSSFFLPGGPIIGSVLGLASSIALQSNTVKTFLFGEETDGKREGGLFGKISIFMRTHIFEQAKLDILKFGTNLKFWFNENIGNRVVTAIKPFTEELKDRGRKIFDWMKGTFERIFEKSVGTPIKDFVTTKVLDPLKSVFRNTIGKLFDGVKWAAAKPFEMLENKAIKLAKKHKKEGKEYVDDWAKGALERRQKTREDKLAALDKLKIREDKLKILQGALDKHGFDITNPEVKKVMDLYNLEYKNGKWKQDNMDKFNSVKVIEDDTGAIRGILDKLYNYVIGAKDKVVDKVKNTFSKDEDSDLEKLAIEKQSKFNMIKNKIKDKFKSDDEDDLLDLMSSKHDDSKAKKEKGGFFKDFKDLVDFNIAFAKEDYKEKKAKLKEGLSDSYNDFKSKIDKIKKRKNKNDTLDFMSRRHDYESHESNAINSEDNLEKLKEDTKKIKKEKIDRTRPPEIKTEDVKATKVKGTIMASDITSMKESLLTIKREVYGQLDGVGHNIEIIKKSINKIFGLDEKGTPMRGNKKRSIWHRIGNFFARPITFVKDKINAAVTNVTDKFKALGTAAKETVGNIVNFGKGIVKTGWSIVKGIGSAIKGAASFLLTAGKTLVNVTGQIAISTIQAAGSMLSGILKGFGHAVGSVAEGLGYATGSIVKGLGFATGKLIQGIGHLTAGLGKLGEGILSLTGSVLSATGKLVKGIANVTAELAKAAVSMTKTIFKGAFELIKSPFKLIGKAFNRLKLGGQPVHVLNFKDLVTASASSPLSVRVMGGVIDAIGQGTPIAPVNKNPELQNNVIDLNSYRESKTEGQSKAKKETSTNDSNDEEVAATKENTSVLEEIKNIIKGIFSNDNNIDILSNNIKSKDVPETNIITTKPQRETAPVTNISDALRAKEQKKKIFSQAKTDVDNHAKMMVVSKADPLNISNNIENVTGDSLAVTQAVAQSAEATKGTFGLLAKGMSKKGLLGKLSSLLIFALPTILKGINFLKNNGLLGTLKFLGKGLASLPFKIGAGLVKTVGKLAETVLLKPLFKLLDFGISSVGKLFSGARKFLLKALPYLGLAGTAENPSKLKRLLSGKKKKEIELDKNGKPKGFLNKVKSKTKVNDGEGFFTGNYKKLKSKITGKPIETKPKTKIGGTTKTKSKKGLRSKASGLLDMTTGFLGPEGIDLSDISSSIVVNGNVAVISKGNVSGLGGGNSLSDALGDTVENAALDKLEEKVEGKGKKKKGKNKKGKGKEKVSTVSEGLEDIAEEVAEGAEKGAKPLSKGLKIGGKSVSVFGSHGAGNLAARVADSAGMGTLGTLGMMGAAELGQNKLEGLVTSILNSKFIQNAFGKHADKLPRLGKFILGKLEKIGGKKLATLTAKMAGKLTTLVGSGVATLGIVPSLMIGYDATSGAFEAQRIFKVPADTEVTAGMRLATSLAKLIDNNLTFGFIDISTIATFIYSLISSDEDEKKLSASQDIFKKQYDDYVAAQESSGQEAMSFDDYNEKQNKSMFGKIASGISNGFSWGVDKLKGGMSWIGDKLFGGSDKKDTKGAGTTTNLIKGAMGGLAGMAGLSALTNKSDAKQLKNTGKANPITEDTIQTTLMKDTLTSLPDDPGNTMEQYLQNINQNNSSMTSLMTAVNKSSRLSVSLLNRTAKDTQLVMQKSSDTIANTASQYDSVASSAAGLSTSIAASSSIVGNTASAVPSSSSSLASTPLLSSSGTTPPISHQSGGGLFSSIGNSIKSAASKVKKFFGFGNGDGTSSGPTNPSSPGVTYKNGMVYFSQRDPRWANTPYNGKGENDKTIKSSGCGPTSAAMVVSSLTGKYVDPVTACDYSQKNGFKHANVGTSWDFFRSFGNQYGVEFKSTGTDANSIKAALSQRIPVILSGAGSAPFTSGGHFIVGAGLSPDGQILVNDPNYESRSIPYSLSSVLSKTRAAWTGTVNGRGLSGSNPAISGGPAAVGGSPDAIGTAGAPQQDNSLLGIFTQLGSAVAGYADATLRGEVYTPNQPETAGTAAGGGAFSGTPTSVNGIAVGTKPLAESLSKTYAPLFDKYGRQYGVDPELLKAMSMQESGGDPKCGYSRQPAWGLMQIENTLASEFSSYGRNNFGQSFSLQDRIVPERAVPFGAKRFSDDLKHYNGDILKTIQSYNFSKYSLDMLIKKYPTNWMDHRKEMGQINGVGGSYGDPRYVENVLRYYHGNQINQGGAAGSVNGPTQGGNGDGLSEYVYEKQQERNTRRNLQNTLLRAAARTSTLMTSPQEISAKPIQHDISSAFVKDYYVSNSNEINDILTAQNVRNNMGASGQGDYDLSQIIELLNQIAENTSETANNTEEIAKKEPTNVVNQNIDNSNTNVTQEKPVQQDINAATINPFKSMENSSNYSKIEKGYMLAKNIAKK